MTGENLTLTAVCSVHGRQVFVRDEESTWWECPEIGMLMPSDCGFVIPDELVTHDGADVVHWSRFRWTPEGTAERRFWA